MDKNKKDQDKPGDDTDKDSEKIIGETETAAGSNPQKEAKN